MLNLESLTKLAGGAADNVVAMRKAIEGLNKKIDAFAGDTSRSQAFVGEQIKSERATVLPKLGTALAEIRAACVIAEEQRKHWANRSLLLSRLPFDAGSPMADATIRMAYAQQLAAMDAPLLTATLNNALADNALALAWACTQAARAAGYPNMPGLDQVQIPEQAEGLALIDSCDAALAEGELIYGGATGLSIDPTRKLTYGRRMATAGTAAALKPTREVSGQDAVAGS